MPRIVGIDTQYQGVPEMDLPCSTFRGCRELCTLFSGDAHGSTHNNVCAKLTHPMRRVFTLSQSEIIFQIS